MKIAVLALDNVIGYELMIPGQVFGMASLADAPPSETRGPGWMNSSVSGSSRYEIWICGRRRRVTTLSEWGAMEIIAPHPLEDALVADLIIVPGVRNFLEAPDPRVVEVLRAASAEGIRIASICVGAFTLAAAGLLDGHRATTHWQSTGELARRYPHVAVEPDVLFVDSGTVVTSAGVNSGLDMCLHLVRQDAGPELAGRTARRLVMAAWRDGGQAQHIELRDPTDTGSPLYQTIRWMERNAEKPLNLAAISEHARMSVRSLNRQFRAQYGCTPLQMLIRIRVDRAKQLLETTHRSMDRIASDSGFGSQLSLRQHFNKVVGVSPRRYREGYRESPSVSTNH